MEAGEAGGGLICSSAAGYGFIYETAAWHGVAALLK